MSEPVFYVDASVIAGLALSDLNVERTSLTIFSRATVLTARASLALKFADAIHVAVAERLGAPLLTSDHQQCRAAQSVGVATMLFSQE